MNTPKTRLTLLGIACGILLALLLAPQTRWLVRLQMLALLRQYHPMEYASYSASPAGDIRAYDTVTAHQPNDFAIQYARATLADSSDQLLINLRGLTRRFPNVPTLYANLLRCESLKLHSKRSDGYVLMAEPVPNYVSQAPAASAEELAVYDREAADGERADPDNAYFPFMRAYGLFAAHRDTEALAAVQRAGDKPLWNEYLTENVEYQWRLHTEAFDDPGALPHFSIFSIELLPQYQRLRETARITVYQAMLKEQAGHAEEGYALREAVRQCGDVMRVQSTTLIGSLVGIAISAIAEDRPGGASPTSRKTVEPSEQIVQQRLAAYCTYVTKIGHPEAAQKARDEESARRRVQGFANLDHPSFNFTGPLVRLIWWWMTGIALLLNAVWLLVFGLLAVGGTRIAFPTKPPTGRIAVATQIAGALGLWLLLFLLLMLVVGTFDIASNASGLFWRAGLGLALAFGLMLWLIRSASHRLSPEQRKGVLRTAALLPVLVGISYGFFCLVQWVAAPLAEIPQGLRLLTGFSGGTTDSDMEQALQTQTLRLCAAISLTIPLLLALVLGVLSLVKRTSLSGTLTAGFQRLAVPIACLLTIAYGGVLIGTLRQERRVTDFSRQQIAEGGRFYAAQAGQPWPGPVQ